MTQATEATTGCTADQRAEWSALHDQLEAAHKRQESAEGTVVYYLRDHVAAGAMAPGEFGVPSEAALAAYRRACEALTEANTEATRVALLRAELDDHPYTRELNARREARP